MQLFSVKNSKSIIYLISALAIFYHLLILTGIVDYKNAWGGQLQNLEQMYVFESISLIIQIFIILLVSVTDKKFKSRLINTLILISLFFLSGLTALNTIGNLFAAELFEKVVFTPITLILSVLFFNLAKARTKLNISSN